MKKSQKRSFTIDVNAIKTLIGAQAGSLQKALLEAVSNALDAKATRVDVKLSRGRVSIHDDGKGMDVDEVLKYFEVFGFDHTHTGHQIGRFGVGRGQLFCFGKNTWTTNQCRMKIDIEKDGLDYTLEELESPAKGTTIDIDLYETLSPYDINILETEFKKMVRYSIIPVSLNGTVISEDATKKKDWTHETDKAWFRLRRDGQLQVYSQGLLVNENLGWRYGVGGEICTKPGFALAQNMARNEVMEKNCPVWKDIEPKLKKQANAIKGIAQKTGTLTPAMRQTQAAEALADLSGEVLRKEALFTLTNGRHIRIETLLRRENISTAATRDVIADKLMQRGAAYILDPITLQRFGVDSVNELKSKLIKIAKRNLDHAMKTGSSFWRSKHLVARLNDVDFHDTLDSLKDELSETYEVVSPKNLSAHEKALMTALRRIGGPLVRAINRSLALNEEEGYERQLRTLEVMESNTMDACTDGQHIIWINQKRLQATKTLPDFMRLIHLMVHEYLHANNSRGGHDHSADFYESFHDLTLDSEIAEIGMALFGSFVRGCKKPSRVQLKHLVDTFDVGDLEVGTGELLEDKQEYTSEKHEAQQPKKKRNKP